MIKYLIFILSTLALFISCNYGQSDGSDLIDKWRTRTIPYNEGIRFYADGSGYYEKATYNKSDFSSKNFTWSTEASNPYKKIILNGQITGNYEYYFSYDKSSLYINGLNDAGWKEFVIYAHATNGAFRD